MSVMQTDYEPFCPTVGALYDGADPLPIPIATRNNGIEVAAIMEITEQPDMLQIRDVLLRMHNDMNQMREDINRVKAYREVRRKKCECLIEMLTTRFGIVIQPTIKQAVQDEPLLKEVNPVLVVNKVRAWMFYFYPEDITRCDRNARACWATLSGRNNRDWVCTNSFDDRSEFIQTSIEEWNRVRKLWYGNPTQTKMIVRFVSKEQRTTGESTAIELDGHTVVTYKYDEKFWTLQAYHDVCKLSYLERDIFADDEPLVTKLLAQEPVSAIDFGLDNVERYAPTEAAISDMTPLTTTWSCDSQRCFYWME